MKNWKVWKEKIEILVMYADEIRILHNMQIESDKLTRTRDIFLIGAFTCLRVEDLLSLTDNDLLVIGDEHYINTLVGKTQKNLTVRLNPIGVEIIKRYRKKYRTLLPPISSVKFNENLKDLAAAFKSHLKELKQSNELNIVGNDWEKDFKRVRWKRGKQVVEYVPKEKFISSHCMRRSGITNLLMLGMTPTEVKTISGHSFNSTDFEKYVRISEQVTANKSVEAWSKALM
ncbi:tyrosine-type recombinase/integrase [Pontibacter sp. BAB1700]|uniref:tyrosine-type recombinase/integrase n=1 Tax=Pontibacter sp. BAB1700 TaxID=1144253 RepID=UPI00178C66F7|nr:tyrosine-type recombinase/integrase [Pontibacter sp. BAB1700]